MAQPKRRHSKARGRKRRTHWVLEAPAMSRCPECKALKRPHRPCPSCGMYKGRKVLPGISG